MRAEQARKQAGERKERWEKTTRGRKTVKMKESRRFWPDFTHMSGGQ